MTYHSRITAVTAAYEGDDVQVTFTGTQYRALSDEEPCGPEDVTTEVVTILGVTLTPDEADRLPARLRKAIHDLSHEIEWSAQ